ncbi:MAG: DUF3159 domain-containing protein [Pseudolysinimonas sp.]
MPDDPPDTPEDQTDFREAMALAMRRTGLGRVAPDQAPSASTLLTAMGGARGIIESILPGLLFLVTYTITRNLWWSVAAPVVIAIAFVVIRLVRRQAVTTAVAGLILILISAVIALLTGRPENNFIPGFFINGGILLVTLITLLIRRPLIGVVASLLLSDPEWRKDPAQLRVAVIATWFWVGLAVIRLGVELPLFFAGNTSGLAAARLITGVPLYAVVLWLTWLVMRTAWTAPERVDDDE